MNDIDAHKRYASDRENDEREPPVECWCGQPAEYEGYCYAHWVEAFFAGEEEDRDDFDER